MTAQHLALDVLSAYLDRELIDDEMAQVETHLDGCAECQERLDGLRSVAFGLRGVERMAPPPLLEQSIRRQLALVDRDVPRWKQPRLVGRLNSNLLLLFTLVIALAVIVAFFGDALSRLDPSWSGSTIIAPPGGLLEEGGRLVVVSGTTFELSREGWVQLDEAESENRYVGVPERWLDLESARRVAKDNPYVFHLLDTSGPAAIVFSTPVESEYGEAVLGISKVTATQLLAER